MRKKSQKPGKSLRIFEIIYLLFLNIPFWRFLQKYPICAVDLKKASELEKLWQSYVSQTIDPFSMRLTIIEYDGIGMVVIPAAQGTYHEAA